MTAKKDNTEVEVKTTKTKTASNSTVESTVKDLIKAVTGFAAKFNNQRTIAVVDLGIKGAHQGTSFRQLFIEASQGFLTVSIQEGFKSAHGGNEQRKPLMSFVVPTSEYKAYELLQARFFNYKKEANLEQGAFLVDTLKKTIQS